MVLGSCREVGNTETAMAKKRKKKLVVSITDFGGEVGKGYTDDTEAFQLAARSRFDLIRVPDRPYRVEKVDLDHRFVPTTKKR